MYVCIRGPLSKDEVDDCRRLPLPGCDNGTQVTLDRVAISQYLHVFNMLLVGDVKILHVMVLVCQIKVVLDPSSARLANPLV